MLLMCPCTVYSPNDPRAVVNKKTKISGRVTRGRHLLGPFHKSKGSCVLHCSRIEDTSKRSNERQSQSEGKSTNILSSR